MPAQKHFLLVEDDDGDAMLLRRCFVRSRLINPVEIVRSGEAAIEYLSRTGRYAYAKRPELTTPSIIFLDLRLPVMNGFQVLKWIRARPELASTRVVVLTGSDNMRDVQTAYELGANSFLIKPVDLEKFAEFGQALGGYWSWSDSAGNQGRPSPGAETYIVQTRAL